MWLECIGVIVDAKLSWNMHVSYISSKATRTLNLLRRNMYFCDAPAKKQGFQSTCTASFGLC